MSINPQERDEVEVMKIVMKIEAVKRIQIENVEHNKGEEALQKLDHPNVVKLYHIESDIDFRYYALEFCQASLDQKFLDDKKERKYRGPMPSEEEVCLQLAKGLAHIHEKKFIHRDLKPENVLIWVDSTGEKVLMKWSGFGLSKQVNERGCYSISGMRGTHNWYSPEILKIFLEEEENDGKTTSPDIRQRGTVKSDVFTAGLVFGYYLLGGDHPFGSAINVLPNIFKNEPVNLPRGEEALQTLNHPNVVKLYDVENDYNFRFYALELCQLSLHQLFNGDEVQKKYQEKMPPDEEVFHQLAEGLAHIHRMQLIHRDLKPHNVLIWVDSTGEKVFMKWADFGLSKQVNESGSHSISEVRGTRNWLSPEILKIFEKKGNDVKTTLRPRGTVKSDVFTAGLVFGYYLLDGDHPFGSGYKILPNIVKNKPVNMPKIKDPSMHAIIMEMLKANPNERISSADVVSRINSLIKFHTAEDSSLIDCIEDSMKKLLESSIESHRTAATYVKVSNNYILKI
ncbi:hypothetical protein DAPPUDRAFT_264519 [Daphnia pulex]|uniref:Protein kinase domain-containing protein n=1 Tax=Daphnia pulex TaxID=6669 RepID=E9HRS0_DAPPU|nr:hypothetical protein DAPPUDRAFT_264519 [Daphnia pulex]|eukprot:EFX65571.1 hypothetical protein DAPPUDRAFT_264519 [Daphnia pulex]